MVNKLTKGSYNTILSQTFSPCGNYLVAGDIYGTISVFYLTKLLNQESNITKEDQMPKNSFTIKDDVQVNSLLTTESFLVVGMVGEIYGYDWKDVKSNKHPTCSWTIQIPGWADSFESVDVNCLQFRDNHLYAGCGDNNLYVFDIERRTIVRTFKGHKDYIHCMALSPFQNQLVSGGEDGSVMFWDSRESAPHNKIEPYSKDKLSRPDVGSWVGAISLNDDWLLCGGGPRLSLWHLRSLNVSTVFPIEDNGIHVAEIYKDKIFAGGRCPKFSQMSFNGDVSAEIPTSAVTTYSAVHREEPSPILCLAGSSPKIDVCSNFIYKNVQLQVS